ncbi:hypothetical protein [Phascolarctid gammaherpesvirus 1]|uniref:Uncharacterized protein n=1 Tax=Phascolarctid gammaherpesvirus 1 TaxID=2249313 RepID=A0A3S8D7V9_9GAMA|nr:hypothetical protein KM711_gp70 [Phascolarctid gammaherpesvirus 1]AZB49246.1 hypothetical protein [Phascolarctid gammaherpesvirus 1]
MEDLLNLPELDLSEWDLFPDISPTHEEAEYMSPVILDELLPLSQEQAISPGPPGHSHFEGNMDMLLSIIQSPQETTHPYSTTSRNQYCPLPEPPSPPQISNTTDSLSISQPDISHPLLPSDLLSSLTVPDDLSPSPPTLQLQSPLQMSAHNSPSSPPLLSPSSLSALSPLLSFLPLLSPLTPDTISIQPSSRSGNTQSPEPPPTPGEL